MSVLEERVVEESNSVEGDLSQEGREMRISEHTQPQQCLHQVWHTAHYTTCAMTLHHYC